MRSKKSKGRIWIILLVCLAVVVSVYFLPPVHSRLAWRVDQAWNSIRLFFNPPEEAVFVPAQTVSAGETITDLPTATVPPALEATPAITATPLPGSVRLQGVVYVDQNNRWNYCGPSSLSMALNFWGWTGNRDDIAAVVRPGADDPTLDFIQRGRTDLNVMPQELEDFVNTQTEYRALIRYGGNIDLLKSLLAAGFPMIVEKGYYAHDIAGNYSWMGHYEFVTGYDDTVMSMLVQDSYEFGPDFLIGYDEFSQGWRAFNYLFLVVYPPEREAELLSLLGEWDDPAWAAHHALEIAEQDVGSLTGADLYFAWYNVGTSYVLLEQYDQAATAYDQSFLVYAALGSDNSQRPYRLIWYETGVYEAYYYTGRYQELIDLATLTLSMPRTGPTLEESLYWRAAAEYALGDLEAASADLDQALYYHPGYPPAEAARAGWLTP